MPPIRSRNRIQDSKRRAIASYYEHCGSALKTANEFHVERRTVYAIAAEYGISRGQVGTLHTEIRLAIDAMFEREDRVKHPKETHERLHCNYWNSVHGTVAKVTPDFDPSARLAQG